MGSWREDGEVPTAIESVSEIYILIQNKIAMADSQNKLCLQRLNLLNMSIRSKVFNVLYADRGRIRTDIKNVD